MTAVARGRNLRLLPSPQVAPNIINRLVDRMDAQARKLLLADVALVPAWMRPIIQEIAHA